MGKFLAVASFYNNTEEYIQQTFDNILNQTHKDWLLIVGDDFSEDEEFRRKLKAKVEALNDKRVLYYPTQFKRELYLYQNTFQHLEYDYYFDLDVDDILDPNLFTLYDKHFNDLPNVYSIFSDYVQRNVEGDLEQWSAVQPKKDYEKEWEFRHNADFWEIYQKRASQKMFGHARCMRRPDVKSLPILESCKTSTDTYFLFYNLTRGTHLNIPRSLYTYIRRPGSDSGKMTTEEHEKFNLNASQFMGEGNPDGWLWGAESVYQDVWNITTAISTTEWLDLVEEFSIISKELTDKQKDKIKGLYPDKKITFNKPHRNSIIAWDQTLVESELLESFKACKKLSCMAFNNDYDDKANEESFKQFNEQLVNEIKPYLPEHVSYIFFRQVRFTVNDGISELKKTGPDLSEINFYWRSGPELRCGHVPEGKWEAQFWQGGKLRWSPAIVTGFWARYSEDWFQEWECRIVNLNTGQVLKVIKPDTKVLGIQIDSGSLGDTLSWMGQIEELTQQRDYDKILVRCSKPWLFDHKYYELLNIHFVTWDSKWTNNWQQLGVYQEEDAVSPKHKHKRDWRTIPLGAIAADQLGIRYVERKPRLAPGFYQNNPNVNGPAICIATNSTAQAKYWNRPGGWQDVVNNLNDRDIKVYYVSKEDTDLIGVTKISDLTEVAQTMRAAGKFIGISSGLSWLAWALDIEVCMISGFTWEFVEFDCAVRIINHRVCSGCWTWSRFDRGDWNWCPQNKGTARQFECTKTISSEYVLQELETAGWFNI
mgnify:FL=1